MRTAILAIDSEHPAHGLDGTSDVLLALDRTALERDQMRFTTRTGNESLQAVRP